MKTKGQKNSAVIGVFDGKCADSIVFNNNDMKLGTELFEKLFASEEYKRAMKYRHYIGFLGHPEDPGCMDYEHACIVMTDCKILDGGTIHGTFDLIDTPVGRVVKAFIDAGVTFGISIRGAGDIDGEGNVDPDTFVFRGFDLVTFPAYDDAIPTFTEIAASKDLDKQVKYKKVCAAVHSNLDSINSCEALDVIQSQFNPDSKEYKDIESRKSEISASEDIEEIFGDANYELDITQQRLEGMTQLYLDQVRANKGLNDALTSIKVELSKTKSECTRKVKAIKRITASQLSDLSASLDATDRRYRTAIAANSRLKLEAQKASEQNLKYVHKIEASNATIRDKDSTISELETKLRETVTASKAFENQTSNLGEEVERLKTRVTAAEQMVLEYQKAYANMYANAIGLHLENLSVTASTTVEQLQRAICGSTSVPTPGNIMPDSILDEGDELEELNADNDESMVTL